MFIYSSVEHEGQLERNSCLPSQVPLFYICSFKTNIASNYSIKLLLCLVSFFNVAKKCVSK